MSRRPTRAQRVLIVASELPPGPGGIGAHAFSLAVELRRQGREVELLGSQHYADAVERGAFNSASPVRVATLPDAPDPLRSALARARALRREIKRFRPDVVVASGGKVLWFAAPLCSRLRVPMVAVAHGTELGWRGWKQLVTRRSFNSAAGIVAVSEFTARLARDMGVARPITVIPNGADADRFRPDEQRRVAFREQLGIADRPMVLTVGNVTERKGQHLVVEALPRLLERVSDVVYVLVGRPTEAEALRDRAADLGVSDHLIVLGQLDADEVVSAHTAADVFAMTSTNTGSGDVEGYGIAVIEAALSGVPAVVNAGTGAEEAVIEGRTGLVAGGDSTSVAESLSALLADGDRRHEMGAEAEQMARGSGAWFHRAARYGERLDEVVAGTRPKIVVVSHTEHWRTGDGDIVGFGPTTRELDHLATLASELVHVAPLHGGEPLGMALKATAPNLRLALVPSAGGHGLTAKAKAVAMIPQWVRVIRSELATADVVHVRSPAGISMVAIVLLALRKRPRDRWIKYAGNWMPEERDALTYRVQRWWLRRGLAAAAVTVNGRWPGQPNWVHSFDNPTLTEAELARGREAAGRKQAAAPWRVVFCGRLEAPKGADTAVEAVLDLRRRGFDVSLDLIGDGPLRQWVERRIESPDGECIRMHGWLRRDELESHIAAGHVLLLPTTASEGFPKVIAEAMAFGCVPVTSPVSSIGQVLSETGGSVVVGPGGSWSDAVESVFAGGWDRLQREGLEQVRRFSYATYLKRVRNLAAQEWERSI